MKGLGKPQELINKFLSWIKDNSRPVGGFILILLGIFIIFRAREIILNLVLFTAGLFMIYYGIYFLGFTKIIRIIDDLGNRIKVLFRR